MAKSNHITISEFYCTQCGQKGIMIPRKANAQREPGHLKNMYCIHCRKENNFVEIRPFGQEYLYEDFLLEFKNGNFNEDGTRKEPYRQFRHHYWCQKNKKEVEENG